MKFVSAPEVYGVILPYVDKWPSILGILVCNFLGFHIMQMCTSRTSEEKKPISDPATACACMKAILLELDTAM